MARRANTGELRALRDRLAGMAGGPFHTQMAQLCGALALKFVADEFRHSHAPDRTPWNELARRRGRPLLDTGRLRASFAVVPISGGFRIGSAVGYAGYHQYGTRPSARAARGARQNARGRFVDRGARTAYLLRIRAHQNPGIPARPMLPTDGIPQAWETAFAREISRAVDRQLRGPS